jgi:ABC-type transport system substrate-binding protein
MMAIDKESFNEAFFFGSGLYINDAGKVAQVVDPRGVVTRDVIPYDLEGAKAIIDREVPADYTLQFIGVVRGAVKQEYIEAVAAMLEKAGFNIDLKIMDYADLRVKWLDGKLGPGILFNDGRKNLIYYSNYSNSPEKSGRHSVIAIDLVNKKVLSDVEVNPDIPWDDLKTLASMDDLFDQLNAAKSMDEYWQTYSDLMDRCIDQIVPGSGFLFTTRIFAARPGVLSDKWEISLGNYEPRNLSELAVYPPEYENAKYHPTKYEGKR